ncbi:Gp49 family protein [Psychrobacter sp. I-STPA10]|uniref:Gp49 family protein n=1 Tax=Psychrobacter sp. I-STPA10 TaxID=2585769 RepID=UPI001E392533|nr:Gp49 family protein [Psychrobacter sp. I-STPA10]
MKLTKEILESHIVDESYHLFPDTTVTVCCLTLDNGFNAIGHSACIEKEMFDAKTGEQVAREKAVRELWQLYGFNAKQQKFVINNINRSDTND